MSLRIIPEPCFIFHFWWGEEHTVHNHVQEIPFTTVLHAPTSRRSVLLPRYFYKKHEMGIPWTLTARTLSLTGRYSDDLHLRCSCLVKSSW